MTEEPKTEGGETYPPQQLDVQVSQFFTRTNSGSRHRIRWEVDIGHWRSSIAYHDLIDYINVTSIAIQGVRPGEYPVSPVMQRLCAIFDHLDQDLLIIPGRTKSINPNAAEQYRTSRMPSINAVDNYRNWSRNMLRSVFHLLEQALPRQQCIHTGELGQYLSGSFGSQTRMDYGNGNELSFMFFLCALFKAEVLLPPDLPAAALMLFARYLDCVRHLQYMFYLRPAGFHGPYSVDDYQFVAFLWGAAQLCYDAPFKPKEMLNANVVERWRDVYLLMGCIAFVGDTKPGEFVTHSSHLWSISALGTWTQIFNGLHNMYIKNILNEFHMLRNVFFGDLMSFDPVPPARYMERIKLGHLSQERKDYLQQQLDKQDRSEQQQQQQRRQARQEQREEKQQQRRYYYYDEVSHSALTLPRTSATDGPTGVHVRLQQEQHKHKLAHKLQRQQERQRRSGSQTQWSP